MKKSNQKVELLKELQEFFKINESIDQDTYYVFQHILDTYNLEIRKILRPFRAKIKNENGELIFDRKVYGEDKDEILELLELKAGQQYPNYKQSVIDIAGIGRNFSFKPLSDYYENIKNIEYIIEEYEKGN
jgi:hypothetical protein